MDRVPKGPRHAIRVFTRSQPIPAKSLGNAINGYDGSDPYNGTHQSPYLMLCAHPDRYGNKYNEQRQERIQLVPKVRGISSPQAYGRHR